MHVLENNAGLLERDFATNKPFYDKFEIKSATKLDEPDVQICYCLKAAINTRFLRKMIEGTLDEELGNTVGTFPLTPTTACLYSDTLPPMPCSCVYSTADFHLTYGFQ